MWQILICNGTKKLCLTKHELENNVYNTDYLYCGCSAKVNCAFSLQENIWELSELNTFKPRKNDNIFHILDQIKA